MTLTAFHRYRGDGAAPPGRRPIQRGDQPGRYLADPALVLAVNTALAAELPLLVTGEPGCGKTELAWSVASELGLDAPLLFHTRSDHQARDVLYAFDHLGRLFDVQAQDPRARDPRHYVTYRALGQAIRAGRPQVVLIDEIDKAPRDFPNDLLDAIDQMEFDVAETGDHFPAPGQERVRPVVIITSNSERELPEAFLRRCVFHRIDPPDDVRLRQIVRERVPDPGLLDDLLTEAVSRFRQLRKHGLDKPPAQAELITWVKVLLRAGVSADALRAEPELARLVGLGALVKTGDDLDKVSGQG